MDRVPEGRSARNRPEPGHPWKHLLKQGIQGVRQVAIDGVWSAMRFRPKKWSRVMAR